MLPRPESNTLQAAVSRRALGGFFVSGLLMAFPGAFIPSWGYHLTSDFLAVGNYFLSMNLGMLTSIAIALWLLPRQGISHVLVLACGLAFASLIVLGLAPPPAPAWYRAGAFVGIGMAAGLLNTSVFHTISAMFRHNPAATVNLSGSFFGLGCLTATLMIAGAFGVYTVPSMLILFALIPLYFGILFWRSDFPADPQARPRTAKQVAADLRSPSAILFSLLLFFQFGNEWSIAGWLVLFLIQRLGLSPTTSLLVLAMYWLALVLGRILAQTLLPRVRHSRLLMGNVLAAMLGCMLLAFTNNLFGACLGVLMVGFGFAIIYPLIVEKIGARFPSYHPGFFNGVFSFALTGGLLAPWLLSFLAHSYGIQIVMALPMLGTVAVFLCLVGIWVEGKLSGRGLSQPESD